METPGSRIVLCAGEDAQLDALTSALSSSGWQVSVLRGGASPLAAQDRPRAIIVMGRQPGAEFEPLRLAWPDVPVLASGAPELAAVATACWLPASAPVALLLGAVRAAAGSPLSGPRAWRRKSDMLVGQGEGIRAVLNALDRLAPSTIPVLVTGESGTGKELVARALHFSGPRADQPFLAVNCAAIPEGLFEAELFGYQRGAFTGAVVTRAGIFEAAHGGTVFLDEIGELPPSLQPKLLRVLETREVVRIGSTDSRQVDVRVVAATNRELEQEVKEGRFREDLYYRLRVYPLVVPPLRARREDIPALVSHQLALICERESRPIPQVSPAALEKLIAYDWPGNVRELVNVLQRALLMADDGVIEARQFDICGPPRLEVKPYPTARSDFDRQYFTRLLESSAGNVSLAASMAHRTRKQVYEALQRLEIDPSRYRIRS